MENLFSCSKSSQDVPADSKLSMEYGVFWDSLLSSASLTRMQSWFGPAMRQDAYKGAQVRVCLVAQSCILFVTLWTVVCQVPPSMRFFMQEYWSGLPFSSSRRSFGPGESDPGLLCLLTAWRFFITKPRESPQVRITTCQWHPRVKSPISLIAASHNFLLVARFTCSSGSVAWSIFAKKPQFWRLFLQFGSLFTPLMPSCH